MADGEQSKATAPALNASSAVEVSNFIMRRMDEKIVLHCIVFWAGQTYLYITMRCTECSANALHCRDTQMND